jgi:hypothetical protein
MSCQYPLLVKLFFALTASSFAFFAAARVW